MKTVNPDRIRKQINKCYMNYDPEWPTNGDTRINGFKYHVENTGGMRLDFEPKIDPRTFKHSYKINQIEIVDEPRFTMWLLKWS